MLLAPVGLSARTNRHVVVVVVVVVVVAVVVIVIGAGGGIEYIRMHGCVDLLARGANGVDSSLVLLR